MKLKFLSAALCLALMPLSPLFALSSEAASKAQPDGNYRFKSDEFSALPTPVVKKKTKKAKKKKAASKESEYFAPAVKTKGDTFSEKFDEEGNVKGAKKAKPSKKKSKAKTKSRSAAPAASPSSGGAGGSGEQTPPRLNPTSGNSDVVNL